MATRSILPNSSAQILQPMSGGFQVCWHEYLDTHTLYRSGKALASHHNGFSCHNLAERILKGDPERAVDQFDYIRDCGGKQHVDSDTIRSMTKELAP